MPTFSLRLSQPLVYFGFLCALCSMTVSAACYYPDGSSEPSTNYQPCQTTGQSMCCSNVDTCSPIGLCIPPTNLGVWRDLCTDPTWNDPACIKLCTVGNGLDGINFNFAGNTVPMTTCGDSSICCGDPTKEAGPKCCNGRKGLFVQNGKVVSSTSTTATPSATPSATLSTIPSAAAASSPSSSTSTPVPAPSSNTGAIVGGVVGGIAGIVILALAFWYFMIRRNMRRGPQPSQTYEAYRNNEYQSGKDPNEMHPYLRETTRNELDSTQSQVATPELQAWHGNQK